MRAIILLMTLLIPSMAYANTDRPSPLTLQIVAKCVQQLSLGELRPMSKVPTVSIGGERPSYEPGRITLPYDWHWSDVAEGIVRHMQYEQGKLRYNLSPLEAVKLMAQAIELSARYPYYCLTI